ncbi:hypothetical protein D3C86_1757960 [compost metagenome]
MCNSNWRASASTDVISSTALTLLASMKPDTTWTLASASAGLPSLVWIMPSSPLVMFLRSGLTSLMRSTSAITRGPSPMARILMVPSWPISIFCSGGTAIGPPLPITGMPLPARSTPRASTFMLAVRT